MEVSFSLENAGGRRVFPMAMMERWGRVGWRGSSTVGHPNGGRGTLRAATSVVPVRAGLGSWLICRRAACVLPHLTTPTGTPLLQLAVRCCERRRAALGPAERGEFARLCSPASPKLVIPYTAHISLQLQPPHSALQSRPALHSTAHQQPFLHRPPAHPASGCACLQGICLVKQKRWGCSTTVVRHKAATALTLSSTIWTNSQAIVEALQRSNNTCADTPAGVCTAFGPPYNYDVLITLKGKCCVLAVQLHFTSAMRDWLQRT